MAKKRVGKETVAFTTPPVLLGTATIAGPKEGKGPLGSYFHEVKSDLMMGKSSWEQAEVYLFEQSVQHLLDAVAVPLDLVDYLVGGDLLDQIMTTNMAARTLQRPLLGLYGACSTSTESLFVASTLLDGGFADHVVVATASHHNTAERQFRYPTELGVQRKETQTWTATGAGAFMLASEGVGPRITHATVGTVVDLGIKDPNNMGAAMAPAAARTIKQHLVDTGRTFADYDLILTGDLGRIGLPLARDLLEQEKVSVPKDRLADCGIMLYESEDQDVHSGGSGTACSALVFGSYLYRQLLSGDLNRILLVATGALLSPTTFQQGESVAGIAHAIAIEMLKGR